jgi:choline dehydrogenase-like flavoprotein
MGDLPETVDVAIIGSGIGGSTIAYGLAGSGARIAILERGFHLDAHPAARDARAIFQRGVFRPVETWLDSHGRRFNPAFPGWYRILRCNRSDYRIGYNMLSGIERGGHGGPGG